MSKGLQRMQGGGGGGASKQLKLGWLQWAHQHGEQHSAEQGRGALIAGQHFPEGDLLVLQSSRCSGACLRAATGAHTVIAHLRNVACSLSGAKAVQGAWGA